MKNIQTVKLLSVSFTELQQEAKEYSVSERRSSCGSSLWPAAPLRRYSNSSELAAVVSHTCLPQHFFLFLMLLYIIFPFPVSFVSKSSPLFLLLSLFFSISCCFPFTSPYLHKKNYGNYVFSMRPDPCLHLCFIFSHILTLSLLLLFIGSLKNVTSAPTQVLSIRIIYEYTVIFKIV